MREKNDCGCGKMEPNKLTFIFEDNTQLNKWNESCEMTKSWYGNSASGDSDEVISIEDFYYYCRNFAAALGFGERTINEWFGE